MYCVTEITEGCFVISVSRGPTTRIVLWKGLLTASKHSITSFTLRLPKSIAPSQSKLSIWNGYHNKTRESGKLNRAITLS